MRGRPYVRRRELRLRIERQTSLSVVCCIVRNGCGYGPDLGVEEMVAAEFKFGEILLPVHKAQILSYLRPSGPPISQILTSTGT